MATGGKENEKKEKQEKKGVLQAQQEKTKTPKRSTPARSGDATMLFPFFNKKEDKTFVLILVRFGSR